VLNLIKFNGLNSLYAIIVGGSYYLIHPHAFLINFLQFLIGSLLLSTNYTQWTSRFLAQDIYHKRSTTRIQEVLRKIHPTISKQLNQELSFIVDYDYDNEITQDELYSSRQGPLSPENGQPMMEITERFGEVPEGIEIWECLETRSLYIRTHMQGNYGQSDYTGEELNEIREIGRSLLS